MAKRRSQFVLQHVERMPRRILEEHPEVVREYVKGKRGVYALYKGARLYYVGLASNLRSRLKAHLRDRHASAWDYFSMYLTAGDQDLRELEALVLMITMPRGNRVKTRFARSQDLRRYFRRVISETQRRELEALFTPVQRTPMRQRAPNSGRQPGLAAYVTKRLPIRMTYRGRVHKALVRSDGTIRLHGRAFNSPSLAASSVIRHPVNGWVCWKYETVPGRWVVLDKLRHRR